MAIGNLASGNLVFSGTTTLPLSGITGAATTHTVTAFTYSIDGKLYLKATASGAATPTTDSAGGNLVLATAKGTVVVWALNAAGTVAIYRGETVDLDSANAMKTAPAFPLLPATACPFAYTLHKNYSGSNFTIGTTNWNTASTAHATQNIAYMPERPQQS